MEHEDVSASQCLLPTELNFYQAYAWCLNPYPTVREAIDYLRGEIGRLEIVPVGWQRSEVATNVFLLSCALMMPLTRTCVVQPCVCRGNWRRDVLGVTPGR